MVIKCFFKKFQFDKFNFFTFKFPFFMTCILMGLIGFNGWVISSSTSTVTVSYLIIGKISLFSTKLWKEFKEISSKSNY